MGFRFGFEHPWVLFLLLVIPAFALYARRWRRPAIIFSRAAALAGLGGRRARIWARVPDWLRAGALAMLIVALAAPRTGVSAVDIQAEGISIVLAVDISSSMLAED